MDAQTIIKIIQSLAYRKRNNCLNALSVDFPRSNASLLQEKETLILHGYQVEIMCTQFMKT